MPRSGSTPTIRRRQETAPARQPARRRLPHLPGRTCPAVLPASPARTPGGDPQPGGREAGGGEWPRWFESSICHDKRERSAAAPVPPGGRFFFDSSCRTAIGLPGAAVSCGQATGGVRARSTGRRAAGAAGRPCQERWTRFCGGVAGRGGEGIRVPRNGRPEHRPNTGQERSRGRVGCSAIGPGDLALDIL
jgi:hypothetical protein